MHPPLAVPSRITIDFRSELDANHAWIIGAARGTSRRVELLAITDRPVEVWQAGPSRPRIETPAPESGLATVDCCCPEFCELDHANE